jgi:hypothetical protein
LNQKSHSKVTKQNLILTNEVNQLMQFAKPKKPLEQKRHQGLQAKALQTSQNLKSSKTKQEKGVV